MTYFSVNSAIRINGKTYTPSVCYPLKDELVNAVNQLKKAKRAKTYNNKVFFQNGKVIEAKIEEEPKKETKKKK